MKQTNLSAYNNDWYKKEIGASALKRAAWYYTNAFFFMNHCNPSSGLKIFLLKLFGARIGTGVLIKPGVNIKYPWKLAIGNNSWVGEKVWIDNLAMVTIGDNVCISQGAMLLTGNHNYARENFDLSVAPINLEAGSWIGANAVVCPGVTAFSHSVLTLKSVATKDLEPYAVYQGNPAVKVRQREIQ